LLALEEKGGLTEGPDAEDEAHKLYNRNLRSTKPDLLAYERQKELALGLAPGTLVPAGTTSAQLAISGSSRAKGLTASEDLYRGANTLSYGDSKPSEDAVDRVVGKINKEWVIPLKKGNIEADLDSMSKGKRKKAEDEDEPVTYINDRNKVFNKKVSRWFTCMPRCRTDGPVKDRSVLRQIHQGVCLVVLVYPLADKWASRIRANFERGTAL